LVILIKFFSTFALVYQEQFSQFIGSLVQFAPFLSEILQNVPMYIVALFSGLADVDAITQQMAELSNGSGLQPLPILTATTAIIIALVTNTAIKIALAKKFGSKLFGSYVLRMLGTVLIVGVLALVLIAWWN
jgi:uncharacterized membrane protein (DUF4010 family)